MDKQAKSYNETLRIFAEIQASHIRTKEQEIKDLIKFLFGKNDKKRRAK